MRRGFSFVEIMIAVAILAVVGMAVVSAISSSAREVKTTSEYSLSMFLSQKIVEDLIQSSHENQYLDEALTDINGLRMPVAGTAHPYFSIVEDSKLPFGELQPGQDVGVEPLSKEVFRLYRNFSLTLGAAPVAMPPVGTVTPLVEGVNLLFDWPGLKGTNRDYAFPVTLVRPQPSLKHIPFVAQSIPGMDDAIRDLVYPGETGSLSSVVGASGNLQSVRDVGGIAALVEFTEVEVAKVDLLLAAEMAKLIPTPPPSLDEEAAVRLKVGSLVERRAAIRWFALLYMETPAGAQKSAFKKSDLGNKPYSRSALTGGIGEACELLGHVKEDIQIALHHYGTARTKMGVPSARIYRRMMLEKKTMELLKLRAMLEATNLTLLKEWQDYLIIVHTGRTRAFADFVTRERDKTPDLAALRAANQKIADRCTEADNATDNLEDLSKKVDQELRL